MKRDFFEGFGETISRTAKGLGERAEQIYETQKLRNKISSEERIINKIKVDMGNILYQRYAQGETLDEEQAALCRQIDQHLDQIKSYKDALADCRGQKTCPSCHEPVERNASFCPTCGAPCPDPEPENLTGEVVDTTEEEIVDVPETPEEPADVPEEAEAVKEPEDTESKEEN